jgi:class 3 adenylate cyclase
MTFARWREYDWQWELHAPLERLWPLVADTDRFNRDTGLPEVTDTRAPDESTRPGERHLRIRVAGIPIEWDESPFQWVAPHRFEVVRRYRRGPLREMRVELELERLATDRTRLRYRVRAKPRGLFGAIAVPLQIGVRSRRAFGRVFERYAEEAARGALDGSSALRPSSIAPGVVGLTDIGASRLNALSGRLRSLGQDPTLVVRLAGEIEGSDETDLARIRPYALAKAWGVERRAVLKLLLHAAREGLLDLRWEVICPLCHGTKEQAGSLEGLSAGNVHCSTCMIHFDTDLERSVELTFVPTAGVRSVSTGAFCVAGPRTTPHVLVQQLLAPGETRSLSPVLARDRYRIRTLDGSGASTFAVDETGAGVLDVVLSEGGSLSAVPGVIRQGAEMRVANKTDGERLVLVDITGWGEDAATAAEVLVLQEFRDLFSREVLAAGRSAGIGTLTVLFTDLKGSTSLYRDLGDGPAFDRVADHFRLLREAIEPERGSVVKTIGDAVMAVFSEPAGAVRAVLRAHASMGSVAGTPSLVLKTGIHAGPCIAVTLNDRLDYFGSTVNVAARLAGLSLGCDVVMSDPVRQDPGVARVLAEGGLAPEVFRSPVRGIEGELTLWRTHARPSRT